MRRRRMALLVLALLALGFLPACRQQMAEQPRYDPLEPSEFFPDGRSARPMVPDTVARGHLRDDPLLYTGRRPEVAAASQAAAVLGAAAGPNLLGVVVAGSVRAGFVDAFPFPVTRPVLSRGQQRFNIYCAVCHGSLGAGDGKIVERGYVTPPALYIPRLKEAPTGYLFDVITHGMGAMPDYAGQIGVEDRWAIVAWVRVLQRATVRWDDLTPEEQAQIPPRKEGLPNDRR